MKPANVGAGQNPHQSINTQIMKPITKLHKRLNGTSFTFKYASGLNICVEPCPTTGAVIFKLLTGRTIRVNIPLSTEEILKGVRILSGSLGQTNVASNEEFVNYLIELKDGIAMVHGKIGTQVSTPPPTPTPMRLQHQPTTPHARTTMYR
jgi:hypothetical protein